MTDEQPVAHRRHILAAPIEHPIEFKVEPDDPEGMPGKIIMGAYVNGKLVARKAADKPPPQVEQQIRLRGKSVLPDVRPLIYTGIEQGVGGRIMAILSVPNRPVTYEGLETSGLDMTNMGHLIMLGVNVRLAEDRKFHTNQLLEECSDHLTEILEGRSVPEIDRVLHHLHKEPLRSVGPLMCVHNRPWRQCRECRS
jgi:hypothetical protein